MGFLDNLESNLNNLERNDERTERRPSPREVDRARAQATAEHADRLKKGPFTNDLLTHAVRIGHGSRTKIHMTWIGNVLRLEARDRRLELRPGPDGVLAVFSENGEQTASEPLDLHGDAQALAERWLS